MLAAGRIETEALHPVSVKGITEPVPVFALRRVRSPEEAATAVTRTPFVGRRVELGQFRVMLDTCVEEGHGQTVYVRGEPGIGKTRLLEEFARIAAEKGMSAHRGLVLPFGVGKGQDAIRSLVRSLLGIPPESGKAVRQQAAATAISDGWLDAGAAPSPPLAEASVTILRYRNFDACVMRPKVSGLMLPYRPWRRRFQERRDSRFKSP